MMPETMTRLRLTLLPATSGPDDQGPAGGGRGGAGTLIAPRAKSQSKRPSLYRVLLLNDDYTPIVRRQEKLEFGENRDQVELSGNSAE